MNKLQWSLRPLATPVRRHRPLTAPIRLPTCRAANSLCIRLQTKSRFHWSWRTRTKRVIRPCGPRSSTLVQVVTIIKRQKWLSKVRRHPWSHYINTARPKRRRMTLTITLTHHARIYSWNSLHARWVCTRNRNSNWYLLKVKIRIRAVNKLAR